MATARDEWVGRIPPPFPIRLRCCHRVAGSATAWHCAPWYPEAAGARHQRGALAPANSHGAAPYLWHLAQRCAVAAERDGGSRHSGSWWSDSGGRAIGRKDDEGERWSRDHGATRSLNDRIASSRSDGKSRGGLGHISRAHGSCRTSAVCGGVGRTLLPCLLWRAAARVVSRAGLSGESVGLGVGCVRPPGAGRVSGES